MPNRAGDWLAQAARDLDQAQDSRRAARHEWAGLPARSRFVQTIAREAIWLWDVWPRLDLLIYTPEEFTRMQAEGNGFIELVLSEGVVVHEATPS